jgi:hypothetical protein
MVGINGTRAMTAFNSRDGGFFLTTVGRVQTPTLSVVVDREEKIRKFVSRDYWEIHGAFQAEAGQYPGKWFDASFKKPPPGPDGVADPEIRADRVWSDRYWPPYILLLLAVEFHGGIGLYRLAVKWQWFGGTAPDAMRSRLKTFKWALTVFFLVLGFATLAAYIKIGIAHAPNYGQPFVPAALAPGSGK